MLTLFPVHAPPVPRVHVEPRQPDGTWKVLDRPTGEYLVVYTPRFTPQFRAGHRSGRWYVRLASYLGSEPQSPGYPTARAAIEALNAGHWSLNSLVANRAGLPLRVIWSLPEPSPN